MAEEQLLFSWEALIEPSQNGIIIKESTSCSSGEQTSRSLPGIPPTYFILVKISEWPLVPTSSWLKNPGCGVTRIPRLGFRVIGNREDVGNQT